MSRLKVIVSAVLIAALLLYGGYTAFKWTAMRVYVDPDHALVVVSKFGKPLPDGWLTVPEGEDYKGVEREVRGPGRYFLNPIEYDWKLVDLIRIPAGDPERWEWNANGYLKNPSTAPMIGLVSLKEGAAASDGAEIVAPGQKGIQRNVLTPGTYKLNPHRYEVTLMPAVVVPPGSVGVVTWLVEDRTTVDSQPLMVDAAGIQLGAKRRGVLPDVLQPGVYYLNPRMAKVNMAPVGYDAITLEAPKTAITFYTNDGYQVEADFTVVWGRRPADAPAILQNIGDSTEAVEDKVIRPAMIAACKNLGSKYSALMLIQGVTRSVFQDDLIKSLDEQVAGRNIHVLLALIRNITVKDATGKDQTQGLLATIQRANIEIERDLTNKQKTLTATVAASLEEGLKQIDVAREMIAAETNVKVANILAEGQKQAAQIDAQRELDVAAINLEIAQLEAQRTQILGKAQADVQRMKKESEAKGAKMLVEALGSPAAYNRYIFARSFKPDEMRLIFAGPGTFWTDLKTFQDTAAAKLMNQTQQKPKP